MESAIIQNLAAFLAEVRSGHRAYNEPEPRADPEETEYAERLIQGIIDRVGTSENVEGIEAAIATVLKEEGDLTDWIEDWYGTKDQKRAFRILHEAELSLAQM